MPSHDLAVPDTSPTIFLARADLLDLLLNRAKRVVVPLVVAEEIRRYPRFDSAVRALEQTPWFSVGPPAPVPDIIRSLGLGPGGTAVLSLTLVTPSSVAILDDLAARRHAQRLGVNVRGTIGRVLAAKEDHSIASARKVREQLGATGMYLSESVMNAALQRVNE